MSCLTLPKSSQFKLSWQTHFERVTFSGMQGKHCWASLDACVLGHSQKLVLKPEVTIQSFTSGFITLLNWELSNSLCGSSWSTETVPNTTLYIFVPSFYMSLVFYSREDATHKQITHQRKADCSQWYKWNCSVLICGSLCCPRDPA